MNTTISQKINTLTTAIKANKVLTMSEYKELTLAEATNGIHLYTNTLEGQHRIMKHHITLLKN
jgi:hypothetical protein